MRPINDQVIIEEIKEETKKLGSIELPPTVHPSEKLTKGIVKFVNETYTLPSGAVVKSNVKEGNTVLLFSRTPKLFYGDREYFITKEAALFAIIEE